MSCHPKCWLISFQHRLFRVDCHWVETYRRNGEKKNSHARVNMDWWCVLNKQPFRVSLFCCRFKRLFNYQFGDVHISLVNWIWKVGFFCINFEISRCHILLFHCSNIIRISISNFYFCLCVSVSGIRQTNQLVSL